MYTVMRVHDFDAAEHLPAVLLDRLWPRGVRKERLEGTVWEKAATPSTALRVWFHEDREGRFDEFCRRLRQELAEPEAQQALERIRALEKQQGEIHLLTAARDPEHSHLVVIRELLQS
ncbi:MAG: DUF488 family protein [Ramlibacter sp.]|nr:DUF488 family protein [Ramlibacter sp.]